MIRIFFFIYIILFTLTSKAAEFVVDAKTAILQDYLSGEILYEKEPDMSIYPASMTKIMTSIIAFDLLKKGQLNLDEKFIVSENAWRLANAGYSSMFIMIGDEVSVENLLKGIIVASGNDACVALAEGIAGSEEEFAVMMTSKAKEIGMTNTNFSNASGINDPDNYSTARDILIMSDYLIRNFPEYYTYFAEKEFTWDRTGGDPITQGNRNPLLYKNMGADGIKTGYLAVEQYSLASSILRNQRRLIAVGSGFSSKKARSKQSSRLLTYGLTNFDTIEIFNKNNSFEELNVWLGKKNTVKTHFEKNIYKTIQKARLSHLKVVLEHEGPIKAPISKNQIVGEVKIYYKDNLIETLDLLASENIDQVNKFTKLIRSINFLIWGDV
jgi:D-alanyl-D-alanine carboxypeptidase (penicillin-binding protein 5/6)|tara:strand:+ start:422 stop:1570 length:1149 start_codon:yes stop_codon:yes gene_type:complete